MGIHSFFHSEFCLTTFPKPPPKRCLHILRSRASSFKWEYPLLSLRLSSSFLRLLPRLLATSISPFILPSITCFRRQFLRKMCPIQLAFRFLISCRIFLCSYIYISSTIPGLVLTFEPRTHDGIYPTITWRLWSSWKRRHAHIFIHTSNSHVVPYSEENLKVTRTSDLSLNYNQTACRHVPEEDIPHGHHCGKLKISRF